MKTVFNEIRCLPEYERDLKKLAKKYRTLEEDVEIFIDKQLQLYHKLKIDNNGIFQIANLGISYPKIYKAKKFACRALKGTGSKSGIRVIYAYFDKEDIIDLIEIYHKGEQENEDRDRIFGHYNKDVE
jgi:mRNA-degrading endonuclease RelE of RelBE toxin-antitoxin system